jgi:hypothetical protein
LTAPPYQGVGFTVTPGVASLPSSGTGAQGSARVVVAFATVLSLIATLVIGHGMWQIRR